MSKPREIGPVGEWTFHDHRMTRFEGRRVFAWVCATDDEGAGWTWVVMLPGRDPDSRTRGEAPTALQAARAADEVGGAAVDGAPDPRAVERWAAAHLKWRREVDALETETTLSWNPRANG